MQTETTSTTCPATRPSTGSAASFRNGATALDCAPTEIVLTADEILLVPDAFEEGDVWLYDEEAERGLAEAEADVKAGRVARFASVDELLKDLRS